MFFCWEKKFNAHLVLLCLAIVAGAMSARGQTVRFSLPTNLRGAAGETVMVPLHLDPAGKAVGSFDAIVEFNPALLTYTEFTAGPILKANDNWFVDVTGNNVKGTLAVGAFSSARVAGSGAAVTLKFLVNAVAAGGDTVHLSLRRLAATDTNVVSLRVEGKAGKFTIKPIIAGHIRNTAGMSLSGVILAGLPNPITTDADGYYRAAVEPGWSGALTPKNDGHTFEPSSRRYTNLIRDQAEQDYRSVSITTNESFAFPNPFNPGVEPVQIRFALQKPAPASIRILDGRGELVKEFSSVIASRAETVQTIPWDGRNARGNEVSNGIYFYVIEAPENRRIIGKIGVAR